LACLLTAEFAKGNSLDRLGIRATFSLGIGVFVEEEFFCQLSQFFFLLVDQWFIARQSRSCRPPSLAPSPLDSPLVAIVVGGLMVAFGEGAAKLTLAGVIFGVMAVGPVNFMAWLFP